VLEMRMDLVFKLVAPYRSATCPISFRVAGLNHEALDDSVEDYLVIVIILAVNCEVFNSFRTVLVKKLDVDIA
jgi:hypothetical protein